MRTYKGLDRWTKKEVCALRFPAVPSTPGRERRPGALKPVGPTIKDASDKYLMLPYLPSPLPSISHFSLDFLYLFLLVSNH